MKPNFAQCVNKGMQRDYSMDKASQEFAYENKNIRITTTGNNSFLSVTNEKSTIPTEIKIEGTILGNATIDNILVLFIKNSNEDYIVKYTFNDDDTISSSELYIGNLGFDINNPIECITSYEGKDVKKVYWVDGLNQPRVINVAVDKYDESETFNFVPVIKGNLKVDITKEFKGIGNFSSGIIQYFITYYKQFGPETNVAYTSALYYISPEDRGGEINEKQTCNFKLSISPEDSSENTTFDGIRVYSVTRTSLNLEPLVHVIYDGPISKDGTIVVDSGIGEPVAPTDVMFLGGNTISASTIEAKDNVLFLGDIDIKSDNIIEDIPDDFDDEDKSKIEFIYRPLSQLVGTEYYNYTPNLKSSSAESKYFKYLEWYRVGIQFKLNTGEWSSVKFLKDIQCDLPIKYKLAGDDNLYNEVPILEEAHIIYVPCIKYTVKNSEAIKEFFEENDIIDWRLVMAEHTSSTRTIKAQGLVLPTIFNLKERSNENCYFTPLWNMGLVQQAQHLSNIEKIQWDEGLNKYGFTPFNVVDPGAYKESLLPHVYTNKAKTPTTGEGYYLYAIKAIFTADRALTISTQDYISLSVILYVKDLNNTTYITSPVFISDVHSAFGQKTRLCKEIINASFYCRWRDIAESTIDINGIRYKIEDILGVEKDDLIFKGGELPTKETLNSTFPFRYRESEIVESSVLIRNATYDVDTATIEEHKNEFFFDANICDFLSPDMSNVSFGLKFRLVGHTDISNSISDYKIELEDSVDDTGNIVHPAEYNFNLFTQGLNYNTGITSFPLLPYSNKLFWVFFWQHSGNIAANDSEENNIKPMFKLKTKTYANMWYCKNTTFMGSNDVVKYPYASTDYIDSETSLFQGFIYKNKYNNLLTLDTTTDSKELYHKEGFNGTSPKEEVSKATNQSMGGGDYNQIYIKSDSFNHCVIDLGNKFHSQYILPNYKNPKVAYESNDNGLIYENFIRKINSDDLPLIESVGVWKVDENTFNAISKYRNNKYSHLNIEYISDYIELDYIIYPEGGGSDIHNKVELNNGDNYTEFKVSNMTFISPFALPNTSTKARLFRLCKEKDDIISHIDICVEYTDGNISSHKMTQNSYGPYHITAVEGGSHLFISSSYQDFHYYTDLMNEPDTDSTSKLWIGEFYTDYDENSFMGGTSDAALQKNVFIPINGNYSIKDNELIGYGIEGDMFYQRWDHLRIKPSDEDSVNNVKDALSIMIETPQNLDGDIRKLRGRTDTINLSEENLNDTLNPVYSQSNNYLTYAVVAEKNKDSYHPNMYVWSLPKQARANIDNWTQLRVSSADTLDGNKGQLTKIKKWGNTLYAFQDKGIAVINFNSQTSLSTLEGLPVEIANSGRVNGHYYISSTQGCKNKWSIVESPFGLYFIDSYNKSINVLGEGIKSLSTTNLFEDWIVRNEKDVIWKPQEGCEGFKTFYDSIHKEVYFVNNKTALCYNELLSQFTSFYDYDKLNTMTTINGHVYGIKDGKLHKMFEGEDYGKYFSEEVKPFYMIYKINKDPFIDKIWTNIEYRADIFDVDTLSGIREDIEETDPIEHKMLTKESFDTLDVWNEYQRGTTDLTTKLYPTTKNKFRIWRTDIPRDKESGKGLDRIRNPWIMLKLTKETTNRMEFHDLVVKYLA